MRVIITGAAGAIGSQLTEELEINHELRLIDRRPVKGRKSKVADLSRDASKSLWYNWMRSHWSDAFQGAEVVVHLAASIHPMAPWKEIFPNNIQATWNIMQAAARHGVSRVVFASSNWAVKARENELAPACYAPTGPKIDSDAPPCPVNAYGLSKAFGETTGRMFVDEKHLSSFVAVRIGNYIPERPDDKLLRTRWIGVQDMRSLLRRCVEANFTGFHVVYGVSAQPTSPYDLSKTNRLLSWEPRQTSMDS